MPIKFGLLTNPANDILEEVKTIHKLGFDYVEVGIELPGGSPEFLIDYKKKIRELINKFNHPALAHTAWWIDFGAMYEKIRQAWVEEAKLCIDAAKALDIEKINFHFYSMGLENKPYQKEILRNIIKSLKEVVLYSNSKGIIAFLENTPNKKSLVSIREYKFVIDNVPKLKVHLDIGHAFIENGMIGIKDYIFAFENKLEHVHVHDNHGGGDEHLPLGKGKINFEQVAKWLKQINYDKTITFEVFTGKEDAKISMTKFKKILSE